MLSCPLRYLRLLICALLLKFFHVTLGVGTSIFSLRNPILGLLVFLVMSLMEVLALGNFCLVYLSSM